MQMVGYIREANIVPVVSERELTIAKEWIAKMQEDILKPDLVFAEFDMRCARYWLRFITPVTWQLILRICSRAQNYTVDEQRGCNGFLIAAL